jgi:glutathione S-transferase
MKLIIGNQNYSSWSMRPWVAMTHFGIDFETVKLWLFTPEFKQQIRAYSNAGMVPVLVDEKLGCITDSLAILETLADTYQQMWPQDPVLRAKARSACARMHSGFFSMRHEMPMNCRALQRALNISEACAKDIAAVQDLWQECFACVGTEGGYLLGEFSIVDAYFAPVVIRLQGYQVCTTSSAQAYIERMLATPAVAAWVQAGQAEKIIIPDDEAGT